jgi:predicted RNA methylase
MNNIPKIVSDNIRLFSYKWVIENLGPANARSILDIGTRESGFAAYLASVGFNVTSIERDNRHIKIQDEFKNTFNTEYEIINKDLLEITLNKQYDILTSIYALQHNIDKDIDCYTKSANICKNTLLIVNEYNYTKTKYELGRDDGDMRIYSIHDIWERIICPINKVKSIGLLVYNFAKFEFHRQKINYSNMKDANTIMIKIIFNGG